MNVPTGPVRSRFAKLSGTVESPALLARGSRWGLPLLAVTLAALGTSAQQPPRPVFKSGIDAVVLDVSVLDTDRRPVRGLTAADFTVLEDGRPQEIATFSAVEASERREEKDDPVWSKTVAADVVSNRIPRNGRLIVLVLDDLLPMAPGESPRAKDLATRVLDSLGPSDLAGVVFISGTQPNVNLTTDHAKLRTAVSRYKPRCSSDFDDDMSLTFAARATTIYPVATTTVRNVVTGLAGIGGRRKTVLWVSAGIPVVFNDPVSDEAAAAWLEVYDAAARGNVGIYTLDPGGLRGPKRSLLQSGKPNQRFLEDVSANTGGLAVTRRNDPGPGLAQVFAETGTYYLIGYQSSNPAVEGKRHKVEVKVRPPHLTVRTRSGYVSSAPNAKPVSALAAAQQSLVPVGDIDLAASVAPFLGADGRSPVLAVVLAIDQAAPVGRRMGTDTDATDVVVSAYDADGKPAGTVTTHVQVGRPVGSENVHYEVLTPITLKPGRYELRIAAATSLDTKAGSVICDVDVPDFVTKRLSMSGVVLSVESNGLVAPRDALRSLLPVVPSARRSFAPTDRVTAFFRVYQGGRSSLAEVSLRVAVLDAKGEAVFEKRETLEPGQFASGRSTEYQFDLPLEALGAGSHLLTVDAIIGKEVVRQTVRFDVH